MNYEAMKVVYFGFSRTQLCLPSITSLLFLIALSASVIDSPAMSASEPIAVQLARGINIFSSKFFSEVAKTEQNKNLVSSPFSAEVIFALLSLGAEGDTHDEILNAMALPDDEFIRTAFKQAHVALSKIQGVQFSMANQVFVSDLGFELAPEFGKDSIDVFQAGVQKISFSRNAEAAGIINTFVEKNTNNRIKDLIQPDDINSNTRVVLVNALHFKGTWKKQFDPAKTTNLPFMVTASKSVQVPMMFIKDDFRYGESSVLDAQLLELPYQGGEMSMLFVLPRKVDGLPELQQKLADGADLYNEIAEMSTMKVEVLIPKFKIETKIDLKEVFKKLGATTVFSVQHADLTKVGKGAEPLYVSQAVQKAFIEVNEEGAEAAAASAVRIQKRSIEFSQEFVCDRPMLFLLCHGEYAIFVGVLLEPSTEHQTERDEL